MVTRLSVARRSTKPNPRSGRRYKMSPKKRRHQGRTNYGFTRNLLVWLSTILPSASSTITFQR